MAVVKYASRDTDKNYFSVKKNIKIAGSIYRVSVCYEVNRVLLSTLDALSENGQVAFYADKQLFVNGVPRAIGLNGRPATSVKIVDAPSSEYAGIPPTEEPGTDDEGPKLEEGGPL